MLQPPIEQLLRAGPRDCNGDPSPYNIARQWTTCRDVLNLLSNRIQRDGVPGDWIVAQRRDGTADVSVGASFGVEDEGKRVVVESSYKPPPVSEFLAPPPDAFDTETQVKSFMASNASVVDAVAALASQYGFRYGMELLPTSPSSLRELEKPLRIGVANVTLRELFDRFEHGNSSFQWTPDTVLRVYLRGTQLGGASSDSILDRIIPSFSAFGLTHAAALEKWAAALKKVSPDYTFILEARPKSPNRL